MTADWKQVRAMFEAACEVPEPDRTAWLDRHVLDGEVRAAVERLLRNVAPATFLEPPGAATLGVRVAPVFPPGQRLGPFLLGPVLGQGGMGVVYAAEQERPRRTVAVKVMRSPIDDPRARVRFEAEIEALARLQHPGIAQVHEAGIEPDGTCWFAMELLRDSRPLNAFEWPIGSGLDHRLATFARICDAVQHAHQRGVIHRDLKPANILVLPDGAIRVIDFGIARLRRADDATLTEAGQLLGTLAYMSPEQAAGGDIDVRTDVYGLGCVLYELLTGRRPFDLDGVPLTTACRVIAEQDPRPPSTLAAGLPREIDWILGQALRKEPRERYAGVAELAADIGRLLADEPVHAAPPSVRYRVGKFVRRNRLFVGATAVVLATVVTAFVTIGNALVQTRQAETAERTGRTLAENARKRAETAEAAERAGRTVAEAAAARAAAALEFLLDVFSAVDPGKDGREVKMADALGRAGRDVAARFAEQPLIRGSLARTIGKAYFGLGMLAEAEQHLRTSVATFEALPEHAGELAQALIELSLVLARRGSLDDAEGALGRAESIAANLPQRGTVADNAATRRADLVRARGDRQKAKAILEPVVARMLAERGATDRSALLAVNLYAGVLHELGELQPAEELYRKAHEGLLATKGPDHPETLATLNNLLMVQFGQGRRRDALPTLQRLLDVRRRVLGDDHPDTITTLSNLGSVQFLLGDYAAAVPAFREASERILAREGDQHPAYAAILGNLASAEREVKEFASAIEHADKALALRRAKLGPTHDTTLTLFAMAADLRRFVGESQQAFEQLQECRRLAQEAKPPQIANVYRCEMGIARALAELGRLDEAEAMFVRCVETWEAADKKLAARGQLGKVDKELADLRTRMGKTPPK